jgi:hypothetical protein
VSCLEPKVPSLATRREETRRGPTGRQVFHAQKPDGLLDVRLQIAVAGRDVRRFPVLGLATPHLTHGRGSGAVTVVHRRHAGMVGNVPWAVLRWDPPTLTVTFW